MSVMKKIDKCSAVQVEKNKMIILTISVVELNYKREGHFIHIKQYHSRISKYIIQNYQYTIHTTKPFSSSKHSSLSSFQFQVSTQKLKH